MVEDLPSSAKEKDARLKFAQRTREGICIGYSCASGGLWNRDYNIIDLETFSRTPAHNPHLALRVREVVIPPRRRFLARCGEIVLSAQRDREKLNNGLRYPLGNAEDTSLPNSFEPAKSKATQGPTRDSEASSKDTPHTTHETAQAEDTPLILDLKEGEGENHADQQANRSIDEGENHVDRVVGDSSVRITEIPDNDPAGSSDDPPRKSVDKSIRFTEPSDTPLDYWEARGDYVIRVHMVPRSTTFTPLESPDSPVHIDSIDVFRTTTADFCEG